MGKDIRSVNPISSSDVVSIHDFVSNKDSISNHTCSSNTPLENESKPSIYDIAKASPHVDHLYKVVGDLQSQIDLREPQLLKLKKRHIKTGRTNAKLELDIRKLENEIDVLISHRKALFCCNHWGIHYENTNNSRIKYRKTTDCRRNYCPSCGHVGSDTNILRSQSGKRLVEVCQKKRVAIGSTVFTTAPEFRSGLMCKQKQSQLMKGAYKLIEKYFGVGGSLMYLHHFGELNANSYADYAPHFNTVFPFTDEDGNKIRTYTLTPQEMYQMKVDWAVLQSEISGKPLAQPKNQDQREKEIVIDHQFFIYDGIDWVGRVENGGIGVRDMNHFVTYMSRSTIDGINLVKQPQNVKDFIYQTMFRYHLSRGYGKLANPNRTKYLNSLDSTYEKPANKPMVCLIDGSDLVVKKLHGSNRAYMSKVPLDSTVAPISEHVNGSSSKLYANKYVINALIWKNIFDNMIFMSMYYPLVVNAICKSISFFNGILNAVRRLKPIGQVTNIIKSDSSLPLNEKLKQDAVF